VGPKGLYKGKIPMTRSEIEPATESPVIIILYSRNLELFNVFSTDSVKQAMTKQNLYMNIKTLL
jgi:hypothetical protein